MSNMLNPFSRAGQVWKHRAQWKKKKKKSDTVYNSEGGKERRERKSVELAENGAEGWKELAQLFHQQPSCYIIVVAMFSDIEIH